MVIARTEALIAGWGQEEALKRAEAYAEAGADAVLIHSKSKKFDELKTVYKAWSGRVPLVVVPTIFDQTTAAEMEEAGAKIIIYANQPVRAAIRCHARHTCPYQARYQSRGCERSHRHPAGSL